MKNLKPARRKKPNIRIETQTLKRHRAWSDIDNEDYSRSRPVYIAAHDADTVEVNGRTRYVNLVSSKLEDYEPPVAYFKDIDGQEEEEWHGVCIDIDIPCELIPSRTPGHHHLYIERALPWSKYVKLLQVLAECEIIEQEYAYASIQRKMTCLRLPDKYYEAKKVEIKESFKHFLEKLAKDENG